MITNAVDISWTNPQGFVVLEGLNGAGKSTLQRALADFAQTCGKECLLTREPGGSDLGSKIRELVLSATTSTPPSALAELFLFAADRAQHVESVIKPALAKKQLVLCDRYTYSTLAFQGAGRGLDTKIIEQTCKIATAGLVPDLVILLDIDPAKGFSRTKHRNQANESITDDRFELEEIAFHERLRESFLNMAKTLPERFLVINSAQEKQLVFETAKVAISSLCKALTCKALTCKALK